MATRFKDGSIARLIAGVCSVALFGGAAATPAAAGIDAGADSSAMQAAVTLERLAQSPWGGAPMMPLLPGVVRGVRTPHQPKPPKPPAAVNVSAGKLIYLKSHHRNPVMEFTIKLSRPLNKQVRVAYSSAPNSADAGAEFKNVTGVAIIHVGNQNYKVRVPIIGPVNVANGSVILSLMDPFNAEIGNGQGVGILTPGIAKPRQH